MSITPLYAGVVTLFFVFLSFRVIGGRRAARVALGDGGDRILLRRLRVHGNFAEYVPLAIVLMALAELQGAPAWTLHLVGGADAWIDGYLQFVGMVLMTGLSIWIARLVLGRKYGDFRLVLVSAAVEEG